VKKQINVGIYLPSATILFYPKHGKEFAGGAELNCYNLAIEMAKDPKYNVSFRVMDEGQEDMDVHGVHVKKIKHLNRKQGILQKIFRQIYLIIQIMLFNEDVIITTTASDHLGLLVLFHQKIKRKHVIFRLAHDYNYDVEHYKDRGRRFYKLYKYGLFNATALVAQTNDQKDALLQLGRQATIIKNGFEIEKDRQTIKNVDDAFILWVARAQPMKRPELFVELAQANPNYSFLMIMPTNNQSESINLRDQILDKIRDLPNLKYIPYVESSEIQSYFDQAILFVNTSSAEGFPNTFIQSGLGYTPVLSIGINPDHIFDRYTLGQYCEEDLSMANAFIRSLTQEKIQEMGKASHQYVEENHSISHVCSQYKTIVEAII
jgi:glycosyltransferase involved in cell wall biosynthesis